MLPSLVMRGLDPAIDPFRKAMDARVKPAHDDPEVSVAQVERSALQQALPAPEHSADG